MSQTNIAHTQPAPLRLLFTCNNLDTGGVEEVILTYAKTLDPTRFQLAVAYFVAGRVSAEMAAIPGITLLHVASEKPLERFRSIHTFARSFKPDIVHNHSGWYGLIVGRLIGAKTVETVHNIYDWFTPTQKLLYGMYANLAQRIIAVSGVVQEFSVRSLPLFPAKKTEVIHNGIVVPHLSTPEMRMGVRRSFGVRDEDILLGYIGRFTWQKGLEYLLHAVKELRGKNTHIKLMMVGEGPLREKLAGLAGELGITDAVLFTGFRRDISTVLSGIDIFVLSSLFEGLPISLLEAMAMGVPAVAVNVGGIPEVIEDGVSGSLVKAEDSSALAEALLRLIEDPPRRISMGKAARERVLDGFSAGAMVAATESIYRSLLTK